ncbi:MAG TPA: hypothetical protein VHB30_03985 [Solirubrobacteraceae bacterium]|jgi:hypothetical protein|nr:hypothetical protein [Solirubrobacteraceae bacterium]
MRVVPYLLALVLGAGAAGLTACGSSSQKLIPAEQAGSLRDDLDAVRAAVADADCAGAADAVDQAQSDLNQMSSKVDRQLRARLQSGIDALRAQAQDECEAVGTVETTPSTTTTTLTTPPTDTTTTATTETVTTETAPTETATTTVETETTTTPAETTTLPTGGAPDTGTTTAPATTPGTAPTGDGNDQGAGGAGGGPIQ